MIKIGDKLILQSKNEVFKGKYEVIVISINDKFIITDIPLDGGKPVLYAQGTMLHITNTRNNEEYFTELTDRKLSPMTIFIIKKPFSKKNSHTQFIAVSSGKGGVGKTSFSINLAVSLSQLGYNTFLLDADMGMANIDILLNLKPKLNIKSLIDDDVDIMDIVIDGPGGIHLIPGGSGFKDLADIDKWKFNKLLNSFSELEKYADYVIIDTGAGIASNVTNFLLSSNEVIIITTPEPHSMTDAYALIKTLGEMDSELNMKLVINKVESPEEAQSVASKIIKVSKQYLKLNIVKFGYILEDTAVNQGIKKRIPFVLSQVKSPASKCILEISRLLTNKSKGETVVRKSFVEKFKSRFFKN